VGMNIDFGKIK